MLLLCLNVFTNRANIRSTHREGTISLLPRKFRNAHVLMHPSRGHFLDLAQNVGKAVRGAKAQQQMYMIRGPADLLWYAVERLDATTKVGLKVITPRGFD